MKAVIIGATGATGKEVLIELLKDQRITSVVALVRNDTIQAHPKLTVVKVDFSNLQQYERLFQVDLAISCLGTTIKDAGSKSAQWQVDHDYQLSFAALCKSQGVKHFVLLSSVGATKDSLFFYNRMKATLEDNIGALNFPHLTIIQPGLIIRPNTSRKIERITGDILNKLNRFGILTAYRSITTKALAIEIVKAAFISSNNPIRRLTTVDLFKPAT